MALESAFAILDNAKKGGNLKASEEVISIRKKICGMCPLLKGKRCASCGCFVNLKMKLYAASCPEGFWDSKAMELAMFGIMDNEFIISNCCGE